jgi:serine/threonine-protein kinase RsbW
MAVVELEIPARPAYLSLVRLVVDAAVGSLAPGLSQARLDDLKIAVTEACSNAIEAHEHSWSDGPVVIRCCVDDAEVRVDVLDRGAGFDPDGVEALPAVTDPRRLRHESGLGIPLMRTLADEVTFTPFEGGTRVSIVVHRQDAPQDEATRRRP